MKRCEFRVIRKGHDYAAVAGVNDPEPRPSDLLGINRCPELEHDDEVWLDTERSRPLFEVHCDIAGALAKPPAMSRKVVVAARKWPGPARTSFARFDCLSQPKQSESAAGASS